MIFDIESGIKDKQEELFAEFNESFSNDPVSTYSPMTFLTGEQTKESLLKKERTSLSSEDYEEAAERILHLIKKHCPQTTSKAKKQESLPPLPEASLVIAGGAGIKNKEVFENLKTFSHLLGAGFGSTQIPVIKKWIKKDSMIGFSGKSIKANLYLAFGISGHLYHSSGIKECETIIAINTDPHAKIHTLADYSFYLDVNKLIPILLEKTKSTFLAS